MECSHPPRLTPDQLSAALSGEAEPDVYAHLALCAGCAARLATARGIEDGLTRRLFRWDCPTPQRLGEYHLGMADQAEVAAITQHLERCPHCAEELAHLGAFLATEPPPVPARPAHSKTHPDRPPLGALMARLLPPTPALALRGEARGPIMAEAGDILIVLDVQPAAEGQVTLLGQVAAPDPERWAGALVQLRQSGALQRTVLLDEVGTFRCEALPAGLTELRIASETGLMIVLPEVDVPAPTGSA